MNNFTVRYAASERLRQGGVLKTMITGPVNDQPHPIIDYGDLKVLLRGRACVCARTDRQGCRTWIIITATPLLSLSAKLMAPYTNAPLCCRPTDGAHQLSWPALTNAGTRSLPSGRQWARQSWRAIWREWWLCLPPAARQHRTPAYPCAHPAAPSRRKPPPAAAPGRRWAAPIRAMAFMATGFGTLVHSHRRQKWKKTTSSTFTTRTTTLTQKPQTKEWLWLLTVRSPTVRANYSVELNPANQLAAVAWTSCSCGADLLKHLWSSQNALLNILDSRKFS